MDLSLAFNVSLAFFFVAVIRFLSTLHSEAIANGSITKRSATSQQVKSSVNKQSNNDVAHHHHTKKTQKGKKESQQCCQTESKKDKESTFEGCGGECACTSSSDQQIKMKEMSKPIKVLYGSQTGTAREWAQQLGKDLSSRGYPNEVLDMAAVDPEDLGSEIVLFFVVSTYTDGQPPEKCASFYHTLDDLSKDFRVPQNFFGNTWYSVFGIGDSVYGKSFNAVGREMDKMMQRREGKRLIPVGAGDNGTSVEIIEGYSKWSSQLWGALEEATSQVQQKKPIKISDEPDEDSADELGEEGEPLVDVEDMGNMLNKSLLKKKNNNKKDEEVEEEEEEEEEDEEDLMMPKDGDVKEMLTPSLRKALTKQGYKLLGSHSGVKLCRWTKAMMRGRGGCYKHTFYGIQSFQCMEMTPSLACANKCVFCWRHHKNPVGKEWRWQVDAPEDLVDLAIKNHQSMVKQMKGVPGVSKERYDEAFTIRHCALSLVGEPIIYPHINRFVELLHSKNISSFLVTNAQFPDKIEAMSPVTQLYVSIDAGTKESLRKVDRPLFADFWERFLGSIDALKLKGQRTVFRLTLIKEWNMEEMANYVELVKRGEPSFIEIKGVTFCGSSKASNLTMKNVPFHQEVVKFSSMLVDSDEWTRENYELACEHEHSCCVLIANKKFKVNGVWNTWIDYPKFHQLAASGEDFTAIDYMAPSPSWSIVGSEEKGFDPEETRFKRTKPYQKGGC